MTGTVLQRSRGWIVFAGAQGTRDCTHHYDARLR